MSLNFNCGLFALFESACEMNQGQTSTGPTFSLSDLPPPPPPSLTPPTTAAPEQHKGFPVSFWFHRLRVTFCFVFTTTYTYLTSKGRYCLEIFVIEK